VRDGITFTSVVSFKFFFIEKSEKFCEKNSDTQNNTNLFLSKEREKKKVCFNVNVKKKKEFFLFRKTHLNILKILKKNIRKPIITKWEKLKTRNF